ncbi:hypothetical protein [Formosa sp. S-31]|uniref:hypothetical protein n=1 Tax=Formosa sp. S-31 TaxID=2790949 RepID=UPI003EB76E8F
MATTPLSTIKNWFKTNLYPTQAQFWATWDSFWHKDEKIPTASVENLETYLSQKVDKVDGYGLTENNFTTEEKQKLEGLGDSIAIDGDETQIPIIDDAGGLKGLSTLVFDETPGSRHDLKVGTDTIAGGIVISAADIQSNRFLRFKVPTPYIEGDKTEWEIHSTLGSLDIGMNGSSGGYGAPTFIRLGNGSSSLSSLYMSSNGSVFSIGSQGEIQITPEWMTRIRGGECYIDVTDAIILGDMSGGANYAIVLYSFGVGNFIDNTVPYVLGVDANGIIKEVNISDYVSGASKYLGSYLSLDALEAAHPAASPGNYANVDAGVGSNVVRYLWDDDDAVWVAGGGGTGVVDGTFGDIVVTSSGLIWTIAANAITESKLAAALLAKINQGVTAYGWGNHADAGYLTEAPNEEEIVGTAIVNAAVTGTYTFVVGAAVDYRLTLTGDTALAVDTTALPDDSSVVISAIIYATTTEVISDGGAGWNFYGSDFETGGARNSVSLKIAKYAGVLNIDITISQPN